MTLAELRTEAASALRRGDSRHAELTSFLFHQRISIAAATLALVAVLVAMRVESFAHRVLLAVLSCAAYWILMLLGEFSTHAARGAPLLAAWVAPLLGAWFPNLAAFLTAALLASRTTIAHGPPTTDH